MQDFIRIYRNKYGIYMYIHVHQRRFQHRRAGRAPPCLNFFFKFVFITFHCITRIYFNCSLHTMFTICILFSTLTTKHRVCVKGASKQTSDPKNSTALGPRPPVLKFLDPPLYTYSEIHSMINHLYCKCPLTSQVSRSIN